MQLGSLLPGEYRLVETEAPDGYILPSSAIRIFVGAVQVTAMQGSNQLRVCQNRDVDWVSGQDKDTWQIQVRNNSGYELPSTGGIGTTIFYVVGGVLVLAALVILVTKKRMDRD